MFIKEIKKRNSRYGREFIYHRLMESYRTQRGPRQRTVVNLGKLDLAKERWKELADCIEAKVTGQQYLFEVDRYIEQLATHYASLLIHRRLAVMPGEKREKAKPEYETVDIKSLAHSQSRTIGAEYVGLSMFKRLGLDQFFQRLGISKKESDLVALSIIGKLVHPGSERRTRKWAKHLSGLDELLGTDFSQLSNNALYRILDLQLTHKEEIEHHLKMKERHLFSLKENIILYDLTNTYFEGEAKNNKKAKNGRSKEKRKDAPLVTLGMIIDEMGFPKTSKLFEGNVSEPATLIEMIEGLQGNTIDKRNNSEKGECSKKDKKGITVVIDAGIAKEENLTLLKREGYDYLCVARNKPVDFSEIDKTALLMIKQDRNNKVEVQMIKKGKESILYCKSYLKAKKEEAMRCSFQERFEKNLKEISASLSKKGGTKKYDKVLERIGRQKEKYSSIAHYYTIEVTQKDGIATTIEWKFTKEQKAEERFSGSYFLRTSRVDLTEEEIWSLYIMLTNVEDAFRYLKSELALRPIWHQKEVRSDAHLFNTLLAYHLLISIQTELKRDEIYMRWCHIRDLLSSHVGITTAMTNKKGKRIYIRDCSDPEPFHKRIYNALKLSYCPIKAKRIKI